MGLNHINLPPSLIAGFYKNHLIESVVTESLVKTMPGTETKAAFQYLGKNQKGICLLVNYPDDVYLPDSQLQFLTTILQACKLNLGDVAIINYHQQKISFEELKKQAVCNYLLIFGVEPAAIGLEDRPAFNIFSVSGCQVVFAPAAEQLNNSNAESKLLKSKLWVSLKQMFNV